MRQQAHLVRVLQSVLNALVERHLNTELAKHQLSLTQYRALRFLAHHRKANVSEMAAAFEISNPAATKLSSRLAAGEWVVRQGNEKDRREVVLALSSKAEAVLIELQGKEAEALDEIMHLLPTEIQQQFGVVAAAFINQAIETAGLADLCLYCGTDHQAECPLTVALPDAEWVPEKFRAGSHNRPM